MFEKDECYNILNDNLCVDNLFYTGKSPQCVTNHYEMCFDIILQGGFELRSWSTNCPELKAEINKNGQGVTHESEFEKIVGYKYNTMTDKLSLADYNNGSL